MKLIIPTDVIIEILSRLPAKSVGRLRTLSKEWCSILNRPDFIELFRSRARPRLLFGVYREYTWTFFSAPQPCSSSLVVTADFHSRVLEDVSRFKTLSYVSGLFYFKELWNQKVEKSVVCNPITGRCLILPEVYMYRKSVGFLVFDPIGKEFKVLAEGHPFCDERDHHHVLTLGSGGELSWRPQGFETPSNECAVSEGICISGVLYYLVENFDETHSVVRFDVRSEEFKILADPDKTGKKRFIYYQGRHGYNYGDEAKYKGKLVNYKGKLGWIEWDYDVVDGKYTIEWYVLEDVEREVWSKHEYTLPENKLIGDPSNVSVAGVTATGEILLTMNYTCKPYYVFYFNPERNSLQSVEIQGFGGFEAVENRGRVTAFLDHVEDLSLDDAVHLKSSQSTGGFANFANQVKYQSSPTKKKRRQCE